MAEQPSPLSAGDRIGPYRIVRELGRGGMGVVYRAHDSRLRRDVALKIMLRPSPDPEQMARFDREARAAGSLNHPNIVAVYDVGIEGGVPYVVTELLEGESLRDRLLRGPIPYRKALEYGVQIALALDAAHRKAIWHRDVKPGNAFITDDGRVKLLDFGIAKLAEAGFNARSEAETDNDSQTGQIRGTPAYMSPEQVAGVAVDHRTDIFALGIVLYEMFTGTRPFRGATTVDTLNAVLHKDPPDPVTINASVSRAASAMVRRCLEKNKEERFQSARDLAFHLQEIGDVSSVVKPPEPGPRPVVKRAVWLISAVALLAGAGLSTLLWWWLSGPPELTFEQLTFRRGRIGSARFATGGQAVVYSEASQGHELEVMRIDLAESPTARPLPYPPRTDVLAARNGDLALLLKPDFVQGDRFVGTLAEAPFGGDPREIGEDIEYADWTPSGELAVVHASGTIGGKSQIESPPGRTIYPSSKVLSFLRVSPDGNRIAFVEGSVTRRGPKGRVTVIDRNGKEPPLTLTQEWDSLRGIAWTPSGTEIWFTAGGPQENRALRAVTLGGKERKVYEAPGSLTLWDIAADGRVLLTRDEERRAIIGRPPESDTERDLSWFDLAGVSAISADGRLLLGGDRFGIFLLGTDGSSRRHLATGWSDALSPDGKTVLATIDDKLVLVPVGAGRQQVLPAYGITSYNGAFWFPEPKAHMVMFTGQRNGEEQRSYVQDVRGGEPRPITPPGQWALAISPNGTLVAGRSTKLHIPIWRVDDGSETLVAGAQDGDRPVAWSEDGRWLWLFRRGEIPAEVSKLEISTGKRVPFKTLQPPDPAGVFSIVEFLVTPSGSAYAYSYTRLLSQLYIVTGLK